MKVTLVLAEAGPNYVNFADRSAHERNTELKILRRDWRELGAPEYVVVEVTAK